MPRGQFSSDNIDLPDAPAEGQKFLQISCYPPTVGPKLDIPPTSELIHNARLVETRFRCGIIESIETFKPPRTMLREIRDLYSPRGAPRKTTSLLNVDRAPIRYYVSITRTKIRFSVRDLSSFERRAGYFTGRPFLILREMKERF